MKISSITLSTFVSLGAILTPSCAFVSSPSFHRGSSSLNAVSKKDSYTVTLLPGDGIGPEITKSTQQVLDALCERCGFELNLKEALIGGAALDACNDPFPDESLEQCRNSDSVLLACIGGYKVRFLIFLYISCSFKAITLHFQIYEDKITSHVNFKNEYSGTRILVN